MSRRASKPGQANPAKGAKVALLTKNGLIAGTLASWSEGGAEVEASGEVHAGARILLRVQGPDTIWEKKATVLWVNKGQSFGLEFEPDGPKKGWAARLIDGMKKFLYASPPRAAKGGARSATSGKGKSRANQRRARRFQIESPAQVVRLDAPVEPEVTTVTETSNSGALFITDRDYPVGTKL